MPYAVDALSAPRTPISVPDAAGLINSATQMMYVGQGQYVPTGALPGAKQTPDACATGTPGGQGEANGPGRALGDANNSALNSGIDPKLSESFNYAKQKWEAENPGMKVYAFSGVSERPQNPSSAHPVGRAMDVAIYGSDGKLMNNLNNGDTPSFRAYESFAVAMGQGYQATQGTSPVGDMRWGGNFGGTWYHDSMHFDVGEGTPPARGNVFEGRPNPLLPNNSDPSKGIKYDGPTDATTANAGQGKAEGAQNDSALDPTQHPDSPTNNAVCSNDSNAGCEPISAGIPGIASSIFSGMGMDIPSMLQGALSGLTSGIGGLLQGGIMNAATSALGSVQALTTAGMPNSLLNISSTMFANIQAMGGSKLPSITGVIPTDLASTGAGGVSGLMTSVFSRSTGDIISPGSAHLGGFPAIFSTAMGSSAGGANLQKALSGSVSQIFGRANDGALGDPTSRIPGFNLASITSGLASSSEDEGIEGVGSVADTQWKPNIKNSVTLTRHMKDVLPDLVNKKQINGFSSLFKDYNSMITQGYGNLTDNLRALGFDLYNLGLVGDLTDLFNIGTARQLARQLVEQGIGNQIGLLAKLDDAGLNVLNMQTEDCEQTVFDILYSIDDGAHVELIRRTMKVSDTLSLRNPTDLIVARRALPTSYDYNYFENIQDMAITLALAGNGIGELKNLGELGYAMFNMETAESFTDLLDEYTLVRFDEAYDLEAELPPKSMFNDDGPVLADFIGSAAGYIHSHTFVRMNELHETIFSNSLMTPYKDLATVLQATLSGTYSGGGVVNPPNTAKYTIGSFANMNLAVADILSKIETELAYIQTTAPTADADFWADLQEYEALHRLSSEYLAHERRMRLAYGIDIGDPRKVTNYYGDGTTVTFALEGKARTSVTVVVNGVVKVEGVNFTHNTTANTITLTSAPTAGQVVSLSYEIFSASADIVPGDTWQLASSIESYALQTGYGGPADFLNKIATNDRHGQRIKAIMMQARNKVRLESVGISCPGFNRVLNNDDDKNINFVDKTGVWSTNPTRAAEIWLQRSEGVDSTQQYIMERLQRNAHVIKPDNDKLMSNVTRRLIFLSNNQLVMTEELAYVYSNSTHDGIFLESRPDMVFKYNSAIPTEGYVLGDYREILTAIGKAEGFPSEEFNVPMSDTTREYLLKIGIDIELLTSVVQRTLLVSLSHSLGMTEEEAVTIFGVQSVSKNILLNIANHY